MSKRSKREHGTRKGWASTNLHGIVLVSLSDTEVILTITYDDGDMYVQHIPLPHMDEDFPAKRGGWTFISNTNP